MTSTNWIETVSMWCQKMTYQYSWSQQTKNRLKFKQSVSIWQTVHRLVITSSGLRLTTTDVYNYLHLTNVIHDCNKHYLKRNQCINNYMYSYNIWQKQQQLLSPLSEHFNKTVTCSQHATTIVSMTNYHNEMDALRHQKHDFIKNELTENFLRVKLDCL